MIIMQYMAAVSAPSVLLNTQNNTQKLSLLCLATKLLVTIHN